MLAIKKLEIKSYRKVMDLLYDMEKVCKEMQLEEKIYREKFKEEWKRIYRNMRNRLESYRFVVKGYGEYISGRSFEMQEKKLLLRVFSYNIKIIGERFRDIFCLNVSVVLIEFIFIYFITQLFLYN